MCLVYTPESIFLMVYFRDQMKNKSSNELRALAGWERIALRLVQPPGQVYLVTGHSSAYTASLIIGCAAGQQIAVVDGAMRFNSYLISRIAAGLDLEPKDLLRRTHVTRSFTAFQTEAAITTRLPEFLQRRSCGLGQRDRNRKEPRAKPRAMQQPGSRQRRDQRGPPTTPGPPGIILGLS